MLRHNEEGYCEHGTPYFPDNNFPLAPESIRDAYILFWKDGPYTYAATGNKQHELALTNTLIDDFCDSYIDAPVYSAAMLGPIADALADPNAAHAARQALHNYATNTQDTPESIAYVLGIVADRPVINEFWLQTIEKQYANSPELLSHLRGTATDTITNELWQPQAHLVAPVDMLALVKQVNLESLLIQSVETLVALDAANVDNDNSNATLERIYKAESFLGPLCEIIGFDGLAMALQSRAHALRAAHTGEQEYIDRARQIIAERGDEIQVDKDVQALFSAIFGEHIHEQVIKHAAPHGIIIGEGLCTSKKLRVVWRLKSVGSLARKLRHENNPDYISMDVLGATIIAHNEDEMAERLGRIIERSHNDEHIKLTPTLDRTDAVQVKGTPDYIESVRAALGFDSVDSMKRFVDVVDVQPGEYRVCKVTLIHSQEGRPDLRAEIQLTTESDRIEARIGSAAHLLYKLASTAETTVNPEHIAAIRARKNRLNQGGSHLEPASAERAAALYQQLIAA